MRASTHRSPRHQTSGFSLLELIVVIAIIGILATIAMPALKDVPRRAAEAVLKSDLRTFRDIIDQYKADKGTYPPSLDALVDEGYLRAMPMDPITKSTETWVAVVEELDPELEFVETDLPEGGQPGVIDVRSGSDATSLGGQPYSEW
jgi:general secretion pathway protein G